MKFVQINSERIIIELFGLRMKFRKPIKTEDLIENLKYELADPKTNVKLPKILGFQESLNSLQEKSLARFGDGEFKLMKGESINFQKADRELAFRLSEVIKNQIPSLAVGLPDIFGKCESDYFKRVIINCRKLLYQYIDFSTTYYNSAITRLYKFKSEEEGKKYYDRIKQLWNIKDIVIVEGEGSRLGIGNDLFSGAKSIKRIICPAKDAFSRYDEILAECEKFDKDILFILALGPTATVLAYDLCLKGYRALDVGHVDTMYEMFLRKADKLVHVEGKVVFNEERNKIPPCKDENYNRQIIKKIGCKN